MRSRYAAYAVRDADYVWRTWHPRTRPLSVTPDPDVRWTGLVVEDADGDEVEFTASLRAARRARAAARAQRVRAAGAGAGST